MAISKIKLPDNSTQDIHDSRVLGVDSTPTADSGNLVTSGGVATALGDYLPLAGGQMTEDAVVDWNQSIYGHYPMIHKDGISFGRLEYEKAHLYVNELQLHEWADDRDGGLRIDSEHLYGFHRNDVYTFPHGKSGTVALVSDIPSTYAGSPSAGGPANKTLGIPFGNVDSTSTATELTATVDNFPTTLTDGVCAYIRNNVIASAANFTLNINGTGALPVYASNADATRVSTVFSAATTYLFIYNANRVAGGCWDIYYGYNSNDNTIGYNLRTNGVTAPLSGQLGRRRLLFTSPGGTSLVPANTSNSTSATAAKTVNQAKIDPFGPIWYYSTTTVLASGTTVGAAYLWHQYTDITLGYSFAEGAALTLTAGDPIYLKCAPQSDGSAIIDADTPYVQTLPSTEDGKIYIFLGYATAATTMVLYYWHPVYYYKDGAIRQWTNAAASGTSDEALTTSEIQDIWDGVMGGATLISFTINGTTYQAEEGMTWGEWVSSTYNTGGYGVSGLNVTSPALGNPLVNDVIATDVIVNGRSYTYNTSGGGSND